MMENCSVTEQILDFESNGILYLIINLLLCVFICSGNIMTITAVWRTKILQTVPNMYIVSLAVADLLVGGVAVPIQALFYIPVIREFDSQNKFFCIFRHVIFFLSEISSGLSMVSIAADRAIYIGYPLRYPLFATVKRAKMVLTFIWIVSFVFGTVPLYFNNWGQCRPCYVFWLIPRWYLLYLVGMFLIVSAFTASLYGCILNIARKQQKRVREETSNVAFTMTCLESDMKLVKSFMIMFGLFFICWLPIIVVVIVGRITVAFSQWISRTLPFAVANSGLNFIVYVLRNADFRKAILRMICLKKYLHRRCGSDYQPNGHRLNQMSVGNLS